MTNMDLGNDAPRYGQGAAHSYGPYAPQQGQWPTQQPGPWAPGNGYSGPQHGIGAPMPGGQFPAGPPTPPKQSKKWPWVVGALGLLFVIGSVSGGEEAPTTAAPASSAAAPAAASAPAAGGAGADVASEYGAQSATFGRATDVGDLSVTAQAPKKRSQEFIGSQYCSTVTLRNTGSSPASFSPFDWKFRTAEGVEATANIPFNADKPLNTGSLRPGGTVTGEVCSDTDTDGVTELVYAPGFGIMHQVTFSG